MKRHPLVLIVLALALALLGLPAAASAAAPLQLWRAPSESDASGTGAGQLGLPRGIGVDPSNGHLFVVDALNARIDELTAWGEFVKAFGWGVRNGAAELQTCGPGAAPPSACQAGIEGSGAGQFAQTPEGFGMQGVAVDGAGDIYVEEIANLRVQKFDPEGNFLAMFGGEVDKTKSGEGGSSEAERNLCTKAELEAGDICGAGTPGTGKGQFSPPHPREGSKATTSGNKIAIGPSGNVFVGDKERIQEFEPSGAYKAEVAVPGETIQSLAIDGAGDFYLGLWGKEGVSKLSPAGVLQHTYTVKGSITFPAPEALALDAAGDLYAVEDPEGFGDPSVDPRVVEFAADGSKLIPTKEEEEKKEFFAQTEVIVGSPPGLNGLATSEACGIAGADLYVSGAFAGNSHANVRAFGPPPQDLAAPCAPPPQVAPTIAAQYAVSAGTDGAVLRANVNPHFWPDTTYYVQYGTGKCSEGGCEQLQPVPPARLGERVVNEPITSTGVNLSGLSPHTTYHYRFIAQSSGGGPVYGLDPDGPGPEEASAEKGLEAGFTTAALPAPPRTSCPNQAFRTGPSASLPDCRAYEMVSPLDKNGADITVLIDADENPVSLDQSAVGGGKLTYSAARAFGDAQGATFSVQYIAGRHERGEAGEGWSNHAITPPRGLNILGTGNSLAPEFRAFSADLCESWLMHDSDPPLAEGAVAGYPNLYRRRNCGEEGYEAITTAKPPNLDPVKYEPDLQGVSADGRHAVFQARDKLTPDANPETGKNPSSEGTNYQCYESFEGQLRLVSVLPDGTALSKLTCSVGTSKSGDGNVIHEAEVSHAISADGSRIYWTAQDGEVGQIYLRSNGKNPTVEVSGAVSKTAGARFLTAAADGSKAIFMIKDAKSALDGNLYEFNVAKGKASLIAPKALGLLGASEDASRIYFVSKKALGGEAVEGKPNLYLGEAGKAPRFIAVLSATDARRDCGDCFSALEVGPARHTARVGPDGLHAVFMSNSPQLSELSAGYDNTDAQSGEPDAEVYLYDATAEGGAGRLFCASCNAATGARPSGRELLDYRRKKSGTWGAARIPFANSQLYAPRVLSDDGSRLFFESFEPLVLRDTNSRQDVYEWERSESQARCEEDGAELYVAADGGCLSLISSGQSAQDSELIDTGADGTDVFFTTGSSLLPQDPGLIDIYDARVGGGFPTPPGQGTECEGQACQNPASAPNDPTPASAGFKGAGNLKERPKPRCAKGRARHKGRCVAKKHHAKHKRHQRAKHKRRAAL